MGGGEASIFTTAQWKGENKSKTERPPLPGVNGRQAPLTQGQVRVPTLGALEALCSLWAQQGRGKHVGRLAWWAAKLGKRTQRAAYRRDMDRPREVPGRDGPAAKHSRRKVAPRQTTHRDQTQQPPTDRQARESAGAQGECSPESKAPATSPPERGHAAEGRGREGWPSQK